MKNVFAQLSLSMYCTAAVQPVACLSDLSPAYFIYLTLLLCEQPVKVDTCMPVDSHK